MEAVGLSGSDAGSVEVFRERRGSIVSVLADELASAITLCHTDYCIALRLTGILGDVKFYSEVSGFNAKELLRVILSSPKVLEAAKRKGLPTARLLEELRRPHFSRTASEFMDVIGEWVAEIEKSRPPRRVSGVCRGGGCRDVIIYGLRDAAAAELARAASVEDVLLKLSNVAKLIYIVCEGDRECFRDYFSRIISDGRLAERLGLLSCQPGKVRALVRIDERFNILIPFEEQLLAIASRAGCPRRTGAIRGRLRGASRLVIPVLAAAALAALLILILTG